MKAVRQHTTNAWNILYIQRWLKAPIQMPDGTLQERNKGTPQGGVISPVLANLFLHYAFDKWMDREHPDKPFARYAGDAVVNCKSKEDAEELRSRLEKRLAECKLELHPTKTRIVYCKDDNRKGDYPEKVTTFWGIPSDRALPKTNTRSFLPVSYRQLATRPKWPSSKLYEIGGYT
jgi:RNA-directed DNA polymerase